MSRAEKSAIVPPARWWCRWLLVAVLLPLLGGCASVPYYWQAVSGHLELMRAREPVAELLAAADTPPELRHKLGLAQQARDFARETLQLPRNDSYTSYVEWPEPYLIWNVVAAPELSLTPREWCFLFVGCVSYRGYYSREDAAALAARLRAEHWEVAVSGVAAYSTLGWFDDPLVSTMMHWSDAALVELIFHEMAHQRVYIKGDSAFNEAYATAVATLGLEAWLAEAKRPALERRVHERKARQAEFRHLVRRRREALEAIYASDRPEADKRRAKAREFEGLREDYARLRKSWLETGHAGEADLQGQDHWIATANNARLALLATYHELVPAFTALHRAQDGDWAAFHRQVETLAELDRDARRERLWAALARGSSLN